VRNIYRKSAAFAKKKDERKVAAEQMKASVEIGKRHLMWINSK